jgi:hypothetical protein
MEEGKFLSISFQSASLSSEVLGRVGYYLWCLMSMVLLSLPNYLSTKIYCEAEESIAIGWCCVSGSDLPMIGQWNILWLQIGYGHFFSPAW